MAQMSLDTTTVFVFDTNVLIALFNHYYRKQFPSLWKGFDTLVAHRQILSVREVYNEVKDYDGVLPVWAKANQPFFTHPSKEEMEFINEIFRVPHFLSLVREKERLLGKPVADPFLIAKARFSNKGCVVTEEKEKPNAAKIPNVCKHFGISCVNLERFMELNDWTF
jgi:hypothetical protein